MSVTVLLAGGTEETNTAAQDFAVAEDMCLTLLDKKVMDESTDPDEIAVYAPGSWIRARTDGPAA